MTMTTRLMGAAALLAVAMPVAGFSAAYGEAPQR